MNDGVGPRALVPSIIGGLSVAGLLIPEAIAYSSIAGLPPSFGLAAASIGPLAYATIGRSRLAVVSATSGAAALLAAAVGNAALTNVGRADCAVALTVLVGFLLFIAAALRISALTSFISRAVLKGFGLGLAITICIRQLPAFLGLTSNGTSLFEVLDSILVEAPHIHAPSAILAASSLIILMVSRRYKLASTGLILIVATTAAMRFAPPGRFGIATAGPIAVTLGVPHVPSLTARDWERLAQLAFPIAIVILAESWATIRSLAARHGDRIDAEREIAALALANLASAIFRGLPVGAGFSIGNANEQAGTPSRSGAVVAAVVAGFVTLTAKGWIALIPVPVLAAIVISALSHALSPRPIYALFRLNRDQYVALTAAIAVLILGIVNGLLVAVALSLLGLLRRFAYPRLSVLGKSGPHDFVDCSTHPDAEQIAGLLVIRPNAPLFFANAETILSGILERASTAHAQAIVLSLEESDDLDSTSVDALRDFNQTLCSNGQLLVLARVHDRVRAVLQRGGLSELAATATFSVDDAVRAAVQSGKLHLRRYG